MPPALMCRMYGASRATPWLMPRISLATITRATIAASSSGTPAARSALAPSSRNAPSGTRGAPSFVAVAISLRSA